MSQESILQILEANRPRIKANIEKWIPKVFNEQTTELICGKATYKHDCESLSGGVSAPIYDMLDRGGKGWRSSLLLLVVEALGGNTEEALDLCTICELIHNGSLIIDDIEDSSLDRRGKPCLHKIYGVDVAINAGNAMYFLPMLLLKHKKGVFSDKLLIKCYELYTQEMVNLHLGQGTDIWWHNSKKESDPTIEQYLQMCAFKTGTLARLSALLGAYVSGASDEVAGALGKFAECIGVAFQIQDDILSVDGEIFSEKKGILGDDIREGKRTLIVLHSFQNADKETAQRLRAILDSHTENIVMIKEAIKILKECGSVEYARNFAKDLVSKSWRDVEGILKEGTAKKRLEAFAEYLIARDL